MLQNNNINEMNNLFKYGFLSEKVGTLKLLIGLEIVQMIKFQDDSWLDFLDYLDDVNLEGYRELLDYFKYEGVLILVFNNKEEYSFFSNEELNSLCVKKEKAEEKYASYINKVVFTVNDLSGENEFKEILNKKIIEINILTTNNLSAKEYDLPSDKGLEFVFHNREKLILTHNLSIHPFVFTMLTNTEEIVEGVNVKIKI